MQKTKLKERIVTPFQILVVYYFIATLVSFLLLRLPWVEKPDVDISYMDTLFTAVSAISVTGLSSINISEVYSNVGLVILVIILQLGAIGVMSIGTLIWIIFGRKIGMRARQLIMIDHNQFQISGVVALIKEIVKILFVIEAFGAFVLAIHFKRYFETWEESIVHGVFTSISSTTNGGFDITGMSMIPYHNDYFVQFVTAVLIILGAIGFPVLIEVETFLRRKVPNFKFSLFTKVTTFTYAVLLAFGTIGIFILESFKSFKGMAWHEALFSAFYHSVSTRSAGLTTYDITQFHEATNLLMSTLMFIGSSPSSVGGGIRTTTFAIAILFLISFAKGNEEIQVFKRRVHMNDVYKSFVVIFLALFMVLGATLILLVTEPHATLIQILFEITSAFGTCGMSLGLTPELSNVGKVVVMVLMFIGRIGIISFLYTLGGKKQSHKFHYPKERIIIG